MQTLRDFAQMIAPNTFSAIGADSINISIYPEPQFASGLHWIIEWPSADGSRRREWAQELDLLIELATATEEKIRRGE